MNYRDVGLALSTDPKAPVTQSAVTKAFGIPRLTARMALAWKDGYAYAQNDIDVKDDGLGTVELTGPYKVEALIKAAGLKASEWTATGVITNCWTTTLKDRKGNIRQVPNYQTKATLARIPTEILTRPRVVKEFPVPKCTVSENDNEVVLFVPDMQVGFVWADKHKYLDPYHDWAAISAVIALAGRIQPHRIIFLGDNADLPALSRYAKSPDMVETTAPALHALHAIYAAFRIACPNAKMTYHLGNHEARLARYLGENAPELLKLTTPNGTLLMGWENLLGLDALHVERVGEYGDIEWLWGELKVHHGQTHASGGGATSTKVARTASYSECFGHTHKVELVNKRIETPEGPRLITVFSPGCLARTDINSPLPRFAKVADFQQGCAVATRTPEGHIDYHVMSIWNGTLQYGGLTYEGDGEDLAEQVACTMDWPQMVKP